jgi:hypothetical protein
MRSVIMVTNGSDTNGPIRSVMLPKFVW